MSLELEAARQQVSERLAHWQGEIDKVLGPGVQLEVDPIGLPREKRRLEQFASTALGAVSSALSDAARDPKFAEYFRSRVAKILVRNDDAAPTSRFDFDVGRRLLVVISTPELKSWVDFLALKEFLAKEL
jgi:hypothetical protein